jgi:hypothetical protein
MVGRKHRILRRAITGLEIVHVIKNLEVNKMNRSLKDISIVNIDVQ